MGLGSGIRKKPIPDPGSRGQKGTGSGSATLDAGMLVMALNLLKSFLYLNLASKISARY
jgi:hypothetical protein